MDRICVGAVREKNIIIYRNDLVSANLKEFIKSEKNILNVRKLNEIIYSMMGLLFYKNGINIK